MRLKSYESHAWQRNFLIENGSPNIVMHEALQLRYQHSPICCSVEAAAGSGAVSILSGSAAAAGSASYNSIRSEKHVSKIVLSIWRNSLLSLTECTWEFQNDASRKTIYHALRPIIKYHEKMELQFG